MKANVLTDQAAGTGGMKLVERPEPQAAINDVVVQIYAAGFVPTELALPTVRRRSTPARRSSSTSKDALETSAASSWSSMSSAATSGSGPRV